MVYELERLGLFDIATSIAKKRASTVYVYRIVKTSRNKTVTVLQDRADTVDVKQRRKSIVVI